jgi:hypothetical protein
VDAVLERPTKIKKGAKVTDKMDFTRRTRIARSLGFHVTGIAPCYPDLKDGETSVLGAMKRFLRELPEMDFCLLRRFRSFVRVFVRARLAPLTDGDIPTVEQWLEESNYPGWRKRELLAVHEELKRIGLDPDKHFKNKCFGKTECYEEFKHQRWIMSRTDYFKVYSGPLFHAIEKSLFYGPLAEHFIKNVPVNLRAEIIKERLYSPGVQYFATDFSSFEASFQPELMQACELQLYRHLASNLTGGPEVVENIALALTGKQRCRHRGARAVGTSRMSGDMCTSLGNGFTNLMILAFAAQENGWAEFPRMVVEGDDGIGVVDGPLPTPEFYAKLGFIIKLDVHPDVGVAGFCQNYFDSDDEHPRNIVDPLKFLGKLGWTTSAAKHGGRRVLLELARAKAFSLLFQCPGNPVLDAMAHWLLRSTEGSNARFSEDWWDKQKMLGFDGTVEQRPVTYKSRLIVEKLFGLEISSQIIMEDYFNSLPSKLVPIDHPLIVAACASRTPDWVTNWAMSTETCPAGAAW